jgi:AraC-like DNA-binding protein
MTPNIPWNNKLAKTRCNEKIPRSRKQYRIKDLWDNLFLIDKFFLSSFGPFEGIHSSTVARVEDFRYRSAVVSNNNPPHLYTYIPRSPLSDFVDYLWAYEPAAGVERALPTGTMELVINLRGDRLKFAGQQRPNDTHIFPGAMICGPHSEYFVIDSEPDESIVGVHFKHGGGSLFLPAPAGELHNTHVALDALWGGSAAWLREQLLGTKTPEARFRLLEQSLLTQAVQPLTWHPAVAFALKAFQAMPLARTIADVTDQIGISQRWFIQVFRDAVGLTPKQFCRVLRFQEVLKRIRQGQQVDWVTIALDCGYYDQAHLIRDFQLFSGLNPTSYVRDRDEHRINHVLIAE